jgi:hypothetical protein
MEVLGAEYRAEERAQRDAERREALECAARCIRYGSFLLSLRIVASTRA